MSEPLENAARLRAIAKLNPASRISIDKTMALEIAGQLEASRTPGPATMHDLPYKLSQIAKSLHGLGYARWSDVVAAAGAEIERLKHDASTPGPATAKLLELCRDTIDRQWLNAPSSDLCRAFIAEQEPARPTQPIQE